MYSHDIEFEVTAGIHKGDRYPFMLATKDGVKQWTVYPLLQPCPSTIKERIEMSVLAQEGNVTPGGALEHKLIGDILAQLQELAEASVTTPANLRGLDGITRRVQIDTNGFVQSVVFNEVTREPEYIVGLVCWVIKDLTTEGTDG